MKEIKSLLDWSFLNGPMLTRILPTKWTLEFKRSRPPFYIISLKYLNFTKYNLGYRIREK